MITYERHGPRATITIDDPERRNPMSAAAMVELRDATRRAADDPDVRVLVYTGAGDRAFSAGGDLASGFVDDPIGLHASRRAFADLLKLMTTIGKPTIARVNGHALAGGFGLAVACDIVVCVDDAKLGAPEINVGLWPMMISAVLVRSMPRKAVLELLMTGRIITPAEARDLGAVSRIVGRSELDGVVDEIVESLAAKSPAAMKLGRDSFYAMVDSDLTTALDRLASGLTAVSLTADSVEGVTAFIEKREPTWVGG